MSKVRVYEVAKQLNLDPKAVVSLFQAVGVNDVRNHMSSVDADAIERVKRHIEKQKGPVVEERIRPGVLKRRARRQARRPRGSRRACLPSRRGAPRRPRSPTTASRPALRPTRRTATRAVPAAEPSGARLPAARESMREVPQERRSARELEPASRRACRGGPGRPAERAPGRHRRPRSSRGDRATCRPRAETAPSVERGQAPSERSPSHEPARRGARTADAPRACRLRPLHPRSRSPTAPRPAPPPPEPVARTTPPRRPPPLRPSSPPKTGVEYWAGRPGVPMPTPAHRAAHRHRRRPVGRDAPARPVRPARGRRGGRRAAPRRPSRGARSRGAR